VKTKIPAREEVTCDCCMKVCEPWDRRKSAILIVQQAGLDYSGCPVGDGTVKYDLCDKCVNLLEVAITNEISSIRVEKDK
jgi:hypothetical protein